ncbi:hypothetical protein S245_001499, partial [Arachis hypogaea]
MNLITSEEKNDGKEIAQWSKNLVDIFCALCVKSIEAGSKPGTHFDTKSWKQLIAEFTKATGKEYNRKQLRNKWDQLKVDWKNWKQLKGNETGLGWDSAKKTIDASEEWWAKKLAVIPKAKKFRKEGIHPDFEATLDRMFQRTAATGEDAWTPSSGIVPSSIEKDTQLEDSEDSDIEPESSVINIKRKRENFTNANTYKKAKKVGVHWNMEIDYDEEEEKEFDRVLTSTACLVFQYYNKYIYKRPCMTSTQTGNKWLKEILEGNNSCCCSMFRMEKDVFKRLCYDLETNYGLCASRIISATEMLAMFLFVLGGGNSNKSTKERFQHSGKTISRKFEEVLQAVCKMAIDIIQPKDRDFKEVPTKLKNDDRYWPHFK